MERAGLANSPISRSKRIVLAVLGAVIAFLAIGPPDFGAMYLFTAWHSDLDGGIHKLHLVMRGATSMISVVAGLILVFKPAWALGVTQKLIASAAGFIVAAILGQFFWPPVVIYTVFAIILAVVTLWAFRGQLFWQQPQENRPTPSRALLGMTALVSAPLIIFGLDQAAIQRTPETLHGDLGHWAGGTAVAVMIILMMLFATRRTPGWRVPAWGAGFTLFMLGLSSVWLPDQASSIGVTWGLLAIAGSSGFVALAEYEHRTAQDSVAASPVQPARS